jgi:hypothetical protein
MKPRIALLLILIIFAVVSPLAEAQLSIPSDGSDGDFAPIGDVEVDLSQAVPGRWDDTNAANAGKGIYDRDKWAIVFKYRSVNVGGITDDQGRLIGARVNFKNHPSRAPVVWLVHGDVQVNGIIDLNGETRRGFDARINAEPGPGGFRGSAWTDVSQGNGFGPGGGGGGFFGHAYGGQYASVYGNPEVLPLIGGSGGSTSSFGYDGGGGAILIAANGTVAINGRIMSNGRGGDNPTLNSASSGAVRVIANRIVGAGEIDCVKDGRIRLEAKEPIGPEFDLDTYPDTVVVSPATPPRIWPPDNAPWVRVLSVDGQEPRADPEAGLERSADLGLQNDNPVTIVLQTRNLPLEGAVYLRIAPKWASGFQGANAFAVRATYVSGTQTEALWRVETKLPKGFTVLQARAVAP